MEVQNILKAYKKNGKALLLIILFGLLAGTGYYFLPKSYNTTGSLYVTRKVGSNSSDYFKYEGYYGQQTAMAYTESVISVLESKDIKGETLLEIGMDVTSSNLRKLNREVDVVKKSPQLVTLTVKGNSATQTQNTWSQLVVQTKTKLENINAQYGDSLLSITQLEERPLTIQTFYPWHICAGVGAGIFMLIYSFVVITKIYTKENS